MEPQHEKSSQIIFRQVIECSHCCGQVSRAFRLQVSCSFLLCGLILLCPSAFLLFAALTFYPQEETAGRAGNIFGCEWLTGASWLSICVSGGRSGRGRRTNSFTCQEATSNHQFHLCAMAFLLLLLLFSGTATDLRCSVWLQIAPGQWWPQPARSVR